MAVAAVEAAEAAAVGAAAQQHEQSPPALFPLHLSPSAQQQQQQQQVMTRAGTQAHIAALEAEIRQRSVVHRQQVQQLAQLSANGKASAAEKGELQRMLAALQLEVSSSGAKLQTIYQAVRQHLKAARGTELSSMRRFAEKLEGAKARGEQQRAAASAAKQQQRSADTQLRALQKRSARTSDQQARLTAAAQEGLQAKAAEVQRQQGLVEALEAQLQVDAAAQLSQQQQQQQQ